MSRLQRFELLTAEQLRNSPSRADGVPEAMEARRRKLAAGHLRQVAHKLQMTIPTWAIAVTFFNRFYTRKSMKKNQTFVIACASLFLAGKVNDEPHSHEKLTNQLLKWWFGDSNPQLLALAADKMQREGWRPGSAGAAGANGQQQGQGAAALPPMPAPPPGSAVYVGVNPRTFWRDMYEAVLEAERALLYTVGFDFNVDIVHTHVARVLNRPRFKAAGLLGNLQFQQNVVGLVNDVYHKDGTLPLQYSPEKIALAAVYFILKVYKTNKAPITFPEPGPNGAPWYVPEGLSVADCTAITNRFTALYKKVGEGGGAGERAGGSKPAPSGAATAGGAASTAMLGACESVAFSGGGGEGTSVGGRPRSSLLSDLGEHTSVPRPLSDGPSVPSGSKRPADSPPDAAAAEAEEGEAGAAQEGFAFTHVGYPRSLPLDAEEYARRSPSPLPEGCSMPAPAARPAKRARAEEAPAAEAKRSRAEDAPAASAAATAVTAASAPGASGSAHGTPASPPPVWMAPASVTESVSPQRVLGQGRPHAPAPSASRAGPPPQQQQQADGGAESEKEEGELEEGELS